MPRTTPRRRPPAPRFLPLVGILEDRLSPTPTLATAALGAGAAAAVSGATYVDAPLVAVPSPSPSGYNDTTGGPRTGSPAIAAPPPAHPAAVTFVMANPFSPGLVSDTDVLGDVLGGSAAPAAHPAADPSSPGVSFNSAADSGGQ
ncbi:MAG TPA: hypothetical protein VJ739_12180, partial [Gemmataceae bacterium]|nr:hypothetical protein [Gemmataceae bacterium]